MKKAIILFSGGLDSTTCLALAKSQGFDCHALSFQYGQRHAHEIQSAERIAKVMGVSLTVLNLPSTSFRTSALVDNAQVIPEYTGSTEIPSTYVPARNTIFLSFALGYAEVIGAQDIFIGVSAIDFSNYPDCRPDYINAFEKLANLATKTGVGSGNIKIHAPLIHLSKAKTIELGLKHGVPYEMTVSCYQLNSKGQACGSCDPCMLRKKGFKEAKIDDPTKYVEDA